MIQSVAEERGRESLRARFANDAVLSRAVATACKMPQHVASVYDKRLEAAVDRDPFAAMAELEPWFGSVEEREIVDVRVP